MSDKIFCPICKSELILTHTGRYEDIEERIFDIKPSFKNGYQCTNFGWCEAALNGLSWVESGEYYSRDSYLSGSLVGRLEKMSTSGMLYALNSWYHYYELGLNEIKKRTIKFNLKRYSVIFEPKMKLKSECVKNRYMPSWFRWDFKIYKKFTDGSDMVYQKRVIPIHTMISFNLRSFNAQYRILSDRKSNKFDLYSHELDYYFNKKTRDNDSRLYMRISYLIIITLYRKKYKKLLEIKNRYDNK